MRRVLTATATVLMLAACSHGDSGGNNSSTAAGGQETQTQPENGSADTANMAEPVQVPSPQTITAVPGAFRGRWAAVADDCTRGGPGLLVIDATGLSLGGTRLATRSLAMQGPDRLAVVTARPDAASGVRTEQLTLIEGGRTLVRQQQAPNAAPNYRRCPA